MKLFTLVDENGLRAKVMTYGAILVSLEVRDRKNKLGDITLGFDSLAEYLTSNLPFSKGEQIFKDPMTTAAAIDRLVHHSIILEL